MIRKLLFLILFLPLLAHSQQTTLPTGATLKAAPSWYLGLDGRAIPYFSGKYYPLMTIQGMTGYQPRIIGNKPAPTGTSYGATDSISQILSNLDNGVTAATIINPPLGLIYNNTNFTSLSDFTNNGATASTSGGKLLINGTGSNFTNSLDFNRVTDLPNWSMKTTLIVPTITSTSNATIGIRSTNTINPHPIAVNVNLSNTVNAGRLQILFAAGLTQNITSKNNLTFLAGDTLEVSLTRTDFAHWTARVVDITRPGSVDASYNSEINNAELSQTQSTGTFSIYASAVDVIQYLSVNINSATPKYAQFAILSDSKLGGAQAYSYMSTLFGRLSLVGTGVHLSSGGDGTAQIISRLPEVISLHPQTVFLDGGRNDLALYGLNVSQVMTNLATIYNTLTAAGIKVWVFTGEYETSYDVGPLAAAIKAAYPNNSIDSYALTKSGGALMVAPDGIHLSNTGEDLLSNYVISLNLLPVKTYVSGTNAGIQDAILLGSPKVANKSLPNNFSLGASGLGVPALTNRANGEKLTLYETISTSLTNYAIGVNTGLLWFGLPGTTQVFGWYAGTGKIAELSGTSQFTVNKLRPVLLTAGTAGTDSVLVKGATDNLVKKIAANYYQAALTGTGIVKSTAGTISYLTDPLPAVNGGTGQSTYATGDLLYASAANTLSKRTIGATNNVLTVIGGVPTWAAPATSGTVTSITPGFGLTPQTAITSTGAFAVDTTLITTKSLLNQYAKLNQSTTFTNDVRFSGTNLWITNYTNNGYVLYADMAGKVQQSTLLRVQVNNAVTIGTTFTDPAALFNVNSTTLGTKLSTLTLAQRNLLTLNSGGSSAGLIYYQTDNTPGYYYYDGTNFNRFASEQTQNTFTSQQTVSNANLLLKQTTLGTNGALFFTNPSAYSISLIQPITTRTYSSTWTLPDIPNGSHGAIVASTDDIAAIARVAIVMGGNATLALSTDYLNATATQYTLTLPTTTGFATDGSKISTVLATGTGGVKISVPSGYAMQSGSSFATTTGSGGVTLTQGQKVQIIPIGANSYYLQPLNGSVTLY